MNIQLIDGAFNAKEGLELITQMLHVKIKYCENKISNSTAEEDIKARETKIKRLQKELFELRELVGNSEKNLVVNAVININ